MNILVVIQARRGSSRLPNKVMLPLAGKPLLQRMVERVKAVSLPSNIVVATTNNSEDDAIVSLCREIDVAVFRGDENDLLDRHFKASVEFNANVCVKIPSDCPLIDPKVIDKVLAFYKRNPDTFDFVSNLHPATYPDGQDVEVIPMSVLETAWKEATTFMQREHTTPFIWDQPDKFRVGNIEWETGFNYSLSHRWTIDYQEDYSFIKTVYDELYTDQTPIFGIDDILDLLKCKPSIHQINAKYSGVNWYRNHLSELHTVDASKTKNQPI